MLTSKRTLSQTGDHSATLFKMVAISILTIFFSILNYKTKQETEWAAVPILPSGVAFYERDGII